MDTRSGDISRWPTWWRPGRGPPAAVDDGRRRRAPSNLALTDSTEPGSVFKLVTSPQPPRWSHQPETAFSVPTQITLDVPCSMSRAAPHRGVDRHPDPGAVLEHRDLRDRLLARESRLLAQVKNWASAADRPQLPGSRRASWPEQPSGSRRPRLVPSPGRRGQRPAVLDAYNTSPTRDFVPPLVRASVGANGTTTRPRLRRPPGVSRR